MTPRNNAINGIIDIEGGYVDNPDDSGGETNFGITVAVALKWGYVGDMRNLPRETAFNIYEDMYWNSLSGDEIEKLSQPIAAEIVDTGINAGVARAGEFLQRSLNILNKNGQLYRDIKADGIVGSKTVEALRLYLNVRKEGVLLKMLNCLQGAFYVELAERREKDEAFIYGWFANRVKI